jgi:hypothetical protein
VEGHGRVGGREAGDGLRGVTCRRDIGDGDGDGNAVSGEVVRELRHGVEVAPDHPCVEHDAASSHCLRGCVVFFCFPDCVMKLKEGLGAG